MNPAVIARAVRTRIMADTGTGGLFSASAGTAFNLITNANFLVKGASALTLPYLVYAVGVEASHTFGGMSGPFTITFTVIEDIANGTNTIESVFDRLIGDAMLATGTNSTPTYGFHNHKLVLPTNTLGALASDLTFLSAEITPDDENYLRGEMRFAGVVNNSAVNL